MKKKEMLEATTRAIQAAWVEAWEAELARVKAARLAAMAEWAQAQARMNETETETKK